MYGHPLDVLAVFASKDATKVLSALFAIERRQMTVGDMFGHLVTMRRALHSTEGLKHYIGPDTDVLHDMFNLAEAYENILFLGCKKNGPWIYVNHVHFARNAFFKSDGSLFSDALQLSDMALWYVALQDFYASHGIFPSGENVSDGIPAMLQALRDASDDAEDLNHEIKLYPVVQLDRYYHFRREYLDVKRLAKELEDHSTELERIGTRNRDILQEDGDLKEAPSELMQHHTESWEDLEAFFVTYEGALKVKEEEHSRSIGDLKESMSEIEQDMARFRRLMQQAMHACPTQSCGIEETDLEWVYKCIAASAQDMILAPYHSKAKCWHAGISLAAFKYLNEVPKPPEFERDGDRTKLRF